MRWSWPSWLAIGLGIATFGFGLYHRSMGDATFGAGLVVAGAILIGAGLHALQSACSGCCGDSCGYGGGCNCDHCEGCKGGDCCGKCACYSEGDGGHEGHGHDGGHSH